MYLHKVLESVKKKTCTLSLTDQPSNKGSYTFIPCICSYVISFKGDNLVVIYSENEMCEYFIIMFAVPHPHN